MLIAYSLIFACVLAIYIHAFTLYLFLAAPCGSRSTGSEGTILSPNYPRNYTTGHSCVYEISVPGEFGKKYTFNLTAFEYKCMSRLTDSRPCAAIVQNIRMPLWKNPFSEKIYLFISEYWCSCNWIGTVATNGMCICVCFCNNARHTLVLMGF